MELTTQDQKVLYDYTLVYHTEDTERFPDLHALKWPHVCAEGNTYTGD
jgi:hypothetical protein